MAPPCTAHRDLGSILRTTKQKNWKNKEGKKEREGRKGRKEIEKDGGKRRQTKYVVFYIALIEGGRKPLQSLELDQPAAPAKHGSRTHLCPHSSTGCPWVGEAISSTLVPSVPATQWPPSVGQQ